MLVHLYAWFPDIACSPKLALVVKSIGEGNKIFGKPEGFVGEYLESPLLVSLC